MGILFNKVKIVPNSHVTPTPTPTLYEEGYLQAEDLSFLAEENGNYLENDVVVPTPTPTPTSSVTPTNTPTPTPTISVTPTNTVTPTPTNTPTPTPTAGATGLLTISEVGSDVVMSVSGTIDLTGLTLVASNVGPSGGGGLGINTATFLSGPTGLFYDQYSGFTITPSNFGTGGGLSRDLTSGDMFGVIGDSVPPPPYFLVVPTGYTSGTQITSTQTFTGQTFTTLGLTVGTYTYTWSGGSFDVVIGNGVGGPTPTPTPTSTVTPTNTSTTTPTPSVTTTNTPTPTSTPTSTPTPTPTPTSSITPTPTVTPTNTVTPSPTPNLVTTGLVIQLDANNISSYPGTGTTVFDVTGGYNHTLIGATYTVLNGIKCFDCTTGNNRVDYNATGPTLPTSGYTYITWTRLIPSNPSSFRTLIYTKGSTKITPITIPNASNTLGYWDSAFRSSGYDVSSSNGVWVQFAVVGTNSSQTFYINGSQVGSSIAYGSGGNTHWGLGNNDVVAQPWGHVANMYFYNRQLNLTEITQQYNYLAPRFV